MDRFKPVNDSLGHAVGDKVLKEVAHILQQNVRSTDLVARLGGDEFVIVMPEPGDADDLDQLCARLIDRSEEHTSELQSLMRISYAVFCLKKKKTETNSASGPPITQLHQYTKRKSKQ